MAVNQGQLVAPTHAQQVLIPRDFKYNKVITVIAWHHYDYFRQVIAALRRAWGSGEYLVSIFVDEPPKGSPTALWEEQGRKWVVQHSQQLQAVTEVGQGGFREVHVNVPSTRVGLWPNKLRAVTYTFTLSDYVVVLEDDIILDLDALRWFEWHVTSGLIFKRPDTGLSTCWSRAFPYDPTNVEDHDLVAVNTLGLLAKFVLQHWTTPWGWAMWQRTWRAVGGNWTGHDKVLGRAIQDNGWYETMPAVALCNNIGRYGEHKRGPTDGLIHERATTSASFLTVDRCQYTEFVERHDSYPLDGLSLYLRVGPRLDKKFENTTLESYQGQLRALVAGEQDKELYKSSC